MAQATKRPEKRTGAPTSSVDDPRFISVARGASKRTGITIPTADPRWLPEARSWYNSLALSGQSEWYEASDWATAVAAAVALNVFLKTYNASIFASFVHLSERLGVTITDRKRNRIELDDPEPNDVDEDAADEVVAGWQARLRLVKLCLPLLR